MDQLLIPATIANRHPDVAIGAANMDMAFRGAIVDLTKFPDFDEVAKRLRNPLCLPLGLGIRYSPYQRYRVFQCSSTARISCQSLAWKFPKPGMMYMPFCRICRTTTLEFGMWPSIYTYVQFLYQQGIALYYPDVVEVKPCFGSGEWKHLRG